MDCNTVAPWIVLPPEDPADRAALAAHLQSCPSCAARAQRAVRLDHRLRSSLIVEPSAALSLRLVALARAAANPALETVIPPALAGTPRSTVPEPAIAEWIHARRPVGWTQRLAGFGLAALCAIVLWNLLGLNPLLSTLAFVWGVVVSIQAILTSPVWLLLADPMETFGPLVSIAAALLLVWLLLHESVRHPRTSPRRLSF